MSLTKMRSLPSAKFRLTSSRPVTGVNQTILVGALFFGCVALAMVHSVPLWIKMTAVTAVVVVALAVLFRLAD